MKEIPLTKGLVAIVDDDDFDELSKFNWHAQNGKYAARRGLRDGKSKIILMHREICKLSSDDKRLVDHKDMNTLNNAKENLRICTKAQNQQNHRMPSTNKSGIKGVHWHKSRSKWMASIRSNGKLYYIGHFESKEQAEVEHKKFATRLHGEFARFK